MSNWPLRGGKGTLFEGGVKGASFLYGWGLESVKGRSYGGLMHATDWFQTLADVAQAAIPAHTLVSFLTPQRIHLTHGELNIQWFLRFFLFLPRLPSRRSRPRKMDLICGM